jgi:hypothetical protein
MAHDAASTGSDLALLKAAAASRREIVDDRVAK